MRDDILHLHRDITVHMVHTPRFYRPLAPVFDFSTGADFTRRLERQEGMISNHIIVPMQAEVERFHVGTTL